jgi:hypothetical protein
VMPGRLPAIIVLALSVILVILIGVLSFLGKCRSKCHASESKHK